MVSSQSSLFIYPCHPPPYVLPHQLHLNSYLFRSPIVCMSSLNMLCALLLYTLLYFTLPPPSLTLSPFVIPFLLIRTLLHHLHLTNCGIYDWYCSYVGNNIDIPHLVNSNKYVHTRSTG